MAVYRQITGLLLLMLYLGISYGEDNITEGKCLKMSLQLQGPAHFECSK